MSEFLARLPQFIGDNLLLSMAFVGVTIALIMNEFSRFGRGFSFLAPAELTRLMNAENALIVDISPIADFEKGHIVGAKHVAMSQFDPESKVLAKAKEQPVAVICRSGMTAQGAAKRLAKAGFTRVHVLEGGMGAWRSADMPVVKGKA
ncbi:MAG: Thiosulfate sulfurtransferase GlpE [Alphaproteobacteria bacterium ADurb.BinA280]|nr:MAG: Thiosulfate sulfurtransferase GlpE [Alphaproteobacteria bacterium ADurb.BinA280]